MKDMIQVGDKEGGKGTWKFPRGGGAGLGSPRMYGGRQNKDNIPDGTVCVQEGTAGRFCCFRYRFGIWAGERGILESLLERWADPIS